MDLMGIVINPPTFGALASARVDPCEGLAGSDGRRRPTLARNGPCNDKDTDFAPAHLNTTPMP